MSIKAAVWALTALLVWTPALSADVSPEPSDSPESGSNAAQDLVEPRIPGDPAAAGASEPLASGDEVPSRGLRATVYVGGARDRRRMPGEDAIEDDLWVAGAELTLGGRLSERTELVLEYDPEIERFTTRSELDAIHHRGNVRFERLLTRNFTFSASGTFLDTEDPARFLDDAIVLLPRAPYRQFGGRAGLEYSWPLTSIRLDVGRVDTRIEPASGVFAAGLDETQDLATIGVDHTFGPRSGAFATYSHMWREARTLTGPDTDAIDPLDEPGDLISLGWRFQPVERISTVLIGGLFDDGLDRSWIAAAELAVRGRSSAWRLRYDRTAASLGGQVAGSDGTAGLPPATLLRGGVTDTARLGFEIGTRAVRWSPEVRAVRTTIRGESEPVEGLAARMGLSVRTTETLDLVLEVDYFDQNSGPTPRESRLRTFAGLRLGILGGSRYPDGISMGTGRR